MNARFARFASLGLGVLYLVLATPVARAWLEATMTGHMLVQIPLLVAIGVASGRLVPQPWRRSLLAAAGGTVPCVVLAIFAAGYWMLPRALDAALANSLSEAAKFASLPALAGFPLALAWQRPSTVGRGFVWINFSSMLGVVGWLYVAAPVRVCNSYLLGEQASAGQSMITLAVLLLCGWFVALFVQSGSSAGSPGLSNGVRAAGPGDERPLGSIEHVIRPALQGRAVSLVTRNIELP